MLKKVNIDIDNNSSFSTQLQTEICTNKVFKKNQNLLFLNKTKIINTLESEYPNLMISSIETHFPNTLLIHAEERKEVFYVKISPTKYISFDKTLKALCEYPEVPTLNLTQIVGVNADDINVGKFLDNSTYASTIKNFYSSMYICYFDETDFISLVRRVEVEEDYLYVCTNYNSSVGTTLKLENPANNLTKKVVYAISALNVLDATQRTHGTILVQENLNDNSTLMCSYIE